jgi:hypothetical protein
MISLLPGRRAALVPVAIPLVARPALIVVALGAGADSGLLATAIGMAASVGILAALTAGSRARRWAVRIVGIGLVIGGGVLAVAGILDV